MVKNKLISKLLLATLLAVSVSGCVLDETEQYSPGSRGGTQENLVTFRVEVSGSELPTNRSMSGGKDYEIGDMDVLLFKIDGTTETYLARKSVTLDADNITVTGTGETTVYNLEFSVSLPSATSARVVLIANAKTAVDAALTGATASSLKREILEKLEITYSDPWPANGSGTAETTGGYKRIPMYGECSSPKAVKGGITIEGIKLIRMLSSIDVTNTSADFELTAVYLVNPNTKGRISPVMEANGKTSDVAATEPHLPANPIRKNEAWSYPGSLSSSAQSLLGEIYAFEAAAASDATQTGHDNSVCLILKGKYKNNPETYYRVDFAYDNLGADAAKYSEYMPLLRNYRYIVSVSSATGNGFASLGEAQTSYTINSNLKTSIIHYDLGDVKNVQFDNGYMLAVSETALEFDREEGEYILKVATTRPEGWQATVVSSPDDWLTIDPATTSGTAGGVRDLKLTYGKNTSGGDRTGTVTIKTEIFTRTVTVKQNDIMPTLTFKVTDISGSELTETSGLVFPYIDGRGTITPQRLILSWSPAEAKISAEPIENKKFVYDAQSDQPEEWEYDGTNTMSPSREHVFEIMPGVISGPGLNDDKNYPAYSRIIEFTATFNGGTITKKIRLEQIACGYGGNALPMMIGKREYLTHWYDDHCWMVENSKEGNPSQTIYVTNITGTSIHANPASNGYWYHWGKAASACPDGWRLPTSGELSEIQGSSDGAKWWYGEHGAANKAFAGYMNYIRAYATNFSTAFGETGTNGYWWCADKFEHGANGKNNGTFTPDMDLTGRLSSVRCVRNKPGESYLNVDGIVPYYARNKDGQTTYKFSIKSNVAWTISPSGDLSAGSVSTTSGGSAGTPTNIEIAYTVPSGTDEGVKIRPLTLTISDDDGKAPPITFDLKTVDCGTHGTTFSRSIGGNTYNTQMHGNQCWMVDNLKGGPKTAYTYGGGASTGTKDMGAIYEASSSTVTYDETTGTYAGYTITENTKTWTKTNPAIGAFEGDYYDDSKAATACPAGWRLPQGFEVTPMGAEVNTIRLVPDSPATNWFKDVPIGAAGSGTSSKHISDVGQLSDPRMSQGYCDFTEVKEAASVYTDTSKPDEDGIVRKTATHNISNTAQFWNEYTYLWPYAYYKNAYYWTNTTLGAANTQGTGCFYVNFNNSNNVVQYSGLAKNRAMCIRCVRRPTFNGDWDPTIQE